MKTVGGGSQAMIASLAEQINQMAADLDEPDRHIVESASKLIEWFCWPGDRSTVEFDRAIGILVATLSIDATRLLAPELARKPFDRVAVPSPQRAQAPSESCPNCGARRLYAAHTDKCYYCGRNVGERESRA